MKRTVMTMIAGLACMATAFAQMSEERVLSPRAPKIIYTFLESHDLSGKTIVPFCTSHSSGIGSSDTDLHESAEQAM